MRISPYSQAAEAQLRTLERNAAGVFAGLNARQLAMETHVGTLMGEIAQYPVLEEEGKVVEAAEKALEELREKHDALLAVTALKTGEVQHRRQVVAGVKNELEDLQIFCKKMPHKTQYTQNRIFTLGQIASNYVGSR